MIGIGGWIGTIVSVAAGLALLVYLYQTFLAPRIGGLSESAERRTARLIDQYEAGEQTGASGRGPADPDPGEELHRALHSQAAGGDSEEVTEATRETWLPGIEWPPSRSQE